MMTSTSMAVPRSNLMPPVLDDDSALVVVSIPLVVVGSTVVVGAVVVALSLALAPLVLPVVVMLLVPVLVPSLGVAVAPDSLAVTPALEAELESPHPTTSEERTIDERITRSREQSIGGY